MNNPYIVGYTRDDDKVITLFSSLAFIYDEDNEYIECFGAQSGDNLDRLESIDGLTIEISDLRCKSYEDVLVQMDLYNLLHGKEMPNEICATDVKTDNALKKQVKELVEENRQLKLKLKQLKNLIDK
jgi:hypothetical protein